MYFRTVRVVDPITGKSEVKTETAENAVRFQHDVIAWDRKIQPIFAQRPSHNVVGGVVCELYSFNLSTI